MLAHFMSSFSHIGCKTQESGQDMDGLKISIKTVWFCVLYIIYIAVPLILKFKVFSAVKGNVKNIVHFRVFGTPITWCWLHHTQDLFVHWLSYISKADPSYIAFHDEEWGVPVHDDKYVISTSPCIVYQFQSSILAQYSISYSLSFAQYP